MFKILNSQTCNLLSLEANRILQETEPLLLQHGSLIAKPDLERRSITLWFQTNSGKLITVESAFQNLLYKPGF